MLGPRDELRSDLSVTAFWRPPPNASAADASSHLTCDLLSTAPLDTKESLQFPAQSELSGLSLSSTDSLDGDAPRSIEDSVQKIKAKNQRISEELHRKLSLFKQANAHVLRLQSKRSLPCPQTKPQPVAELLRRVYEVRSEVNVLKHSLVASHAGRASRRSELRLEVASQRTTCAQCNLF